MADAAQSALGFFVRDRAAAIAPALLLSEEDYQPVTVEAAAATAARGFEDAVERAQHARGRSLRLRGGVATDKPGPWRTRRRCFPRIETAIAGETTAAGVEAAVAAMVRPGRRASRITGLSRRHARAFGNPGLRRGAGPRSMSPRPDVGCAGCARGPGDGGVARPRFSSPEPRRARPRLPCRRRQPAVGQTTAIIETRARVGVAGSASKAAKTRNAAETLGLELAAGVHRRCPIRSRPRPGCARSRCQLETLYTVTARMSRLEPDGLSC